MTIDSRKRAPSKSKARIDFEFDDQFGALDQADRNFEAAAQAEPAQPFESPAGRASVRQNADALSGLAL